MKWRIPAVHTFFLIWGFFILIRLGYWQIVRAKELRSAAVDQYTSSVTLPASRGAIQSRDGFPLAVDTSDFLAYLNPQLVSPADLKFQHFLDLLPSSDSARLALSAARSDHLFWLIMARNLTYDQKEILSGLDIPSLGFSSDPMRTYPEGSPSAYLTGFVGRNNSGDRQGYFGLEGYYDRLLSGKPGRLIEEQDAFGQPILIGSQNRLPPQDGSDLVTSIDRTVQYLAFQHLEAGLAKYQARAGTVSIMETKTGRILALASIPGYNQAEYAAASPSAYSNPIISEAYEPGSTFKAIVMSSALDAGVVTPDTRCDICTGPLTVSGATIRSWNNEYYPGSTMTEAILHSDNIGLVYVARKLGKSRLLSYFHRFGFGSLTGIDMQEESTPVLRPDNQWYELDWTTAAFGQGIAVTRLQMLTAVNAIANHGKLVPPRLGIRTVSGGNSQNLPQPPIRQVISPEAASLMTQMMINGVVHGEVRYYRPLHYLVAGKTGTAQIPISGHYDPDQGIASFVGFVPADDPKFTMLVTLTNPQSSPWGSTTAAPLWFDLARDLFRYLHILPSDVP